MAEEKKLNVYFFPFFESGHMISMADLAALFSQRPNVIPTMCLTPSNAAFLQPTLDPNVKVLTYPFPSEGAGLPPGIENLSSVTPDQEHKIYVAVDLSEAAHRKLLHEHRPDAIVADVPFHWTTAIARELGVPRLTWHSVGVFPQVIMNSLYRHMHEIATAGEDVIKVKDVPGKEIMMPTSELPEFVRKRNFMTDVWESMKAAQLECHGTIVNTFYGLEPGYCDYYRETDCRQAWFVGPVALARGYRASWAKENEEYLKWLDGKEEGSVVFVCFGSWFHFNKEQLKEIAVGLEDSGRSFLWVVRGESYVLDKEWEEKVGERGMVVREWAPQVAILEHKAVGAFLTHCGWNSVLEAISAGVPVLTWPLVFEQFINERLMVEVVEAGKRVFDGHRSTGDEEKVIVPAAVVAKAISEFMKEEGKEGRRRMKAKECAEKAKAAVREGGSSWTDLNSLIHELKQMSACDHGSQT